MRGRQKGSGRKLRVNGVSHAMTYGKVEEKIRRTRQELTELMRWMFRGSPFLLKRRLLTISVMEATFCFWSFSGGIQV